MKPNGSRGRWLILGTNVGSWLELNSGICRLMWRDESLWGHRDLPIIARLETSIEGICDGSWDG
jgi:hypothetical protein